MMGVPESREALRELYLPPADRFVFVDVPEMQFAMIDGAGDPDGPEYRQAVRWLFTTVHPLKRIARERMGANYTAPPLECLFSTDDPQDLVAARRDRLRWRAMIVTADWVDSEMWAQGVGAAAEQLGEVPQTLRLERFDEGRAVQIMHMGDYRQEAAELVRRLHHEFLPEQGLVAHGSHHEIYLTDSSRVAPERMRTVVRQPVRAAG